MFQSIWEDVKREFGYGNMVTRIIIINVAVFVLINLVKLILYISNGGVPSPAFENILNFFCMSADWRFVLTHPWVPFTSMFLHEGFWHILWNMLFLYWFGRIVGDFIGNQRILPIYLLSGLMGALFYFVSENILASGNPQSFALGASGAVMGIVVASAVISPDYIMRLLFLGDVKLKYIVMVLVFLDLISIANDINTGGHFAHLGGVAMGWIFVRQLRDGNDLAMPINNFFKKVSNLFKGVTESSEPRRGPRMAYKNPNKSKRSTARRSKGESITDDDALSHQEQVDAILDKIKQHGYESLSEEEKEFLFNASKK